MHQVTHATFEQDVVAASHETPVLVDFWGPRCGPCIQMMPWVEKLAAERADVVKVVKLNTAENRRLSFDLLIMGLPAFALYRDGKEVQRLSGDDCTPAAITRLVDSALAAS